MEVCIYNFPIEEQQKAYQALVKAGHIVKPLTIPDLYENIEVDYALPPVLVYSDMPDTEGPLIYQLFNYRYPSAVIWMVSPSYRPEDVRTAFLCKYQNYILWSPDLIDFTRAISNMNPADPFHQSLQTNSKYNFRMVSFPLEQQLVTDRILTSITDDSSNLASNYYPLILRQADLRNSLYSICVIRLHLPLYIYIRPDYKSMHSILINQLKLHMETVENITSPHFEMRNIIKNNQLICLFYIKKEFRSVFEAELMDYLKEVNERVKKYTNMPILVGYSHPYSVLSDTHTRYHRIITNLDQGYFFPSQTTNMLDEEREYISFSKEIDDYIQKNLSIAVFNHDSNLIVKTLNEACRQFMEQKVMSTVAKTILLHTLIRFSQETDFYLLVNYEFIERRLYTVMTEIVSFPLLQKLFSLIGELSEQARKIYERDDSNRLTIAMQYIQKYYCHKISLASISNYLALTPNYFCGWFKKQTAENFGDMVIRYRIEAAKTMLTCSKKKMYEIAGEVGYEEIVSFNRVFKKSVGMTPDQYRKAYTVE